jgi:hypothetical protein
MYQGRRKDQVIASEKASFYTILAGFVLILLVIITS